MDLASYIHEAIFEEKEKYTCLYDLIWDNFDEDGFVVTDEPDTEIDCIFKAIAIKNLIGEFVYRLYDEVNETGYDDIIDNLANLGIDEEQIIDYCYENPEIDTDDEDNELSIKNALDYLTEIVADKMLSFFLPMICLITSSVQHMILSRILPLHLRIRMNLLHSLIQIPKGLMNIRRSIRRL